MSSKNEAAALRLKAAAIEAAANRSDDMAAYHAEIAQARRMLAEADRIDPKPARIQAQKKLLPGVYPDFESAAAAARAAVAKKRKAKNA
jgi:hypothetical protein